MTKIWKLLLMSTLIGAEQVISNIKLSKIINEFSKNYGEAEFNFEALRGAKLDPVKAEVNDHGSNQV